MLLFDFFSGFLIKPATTTLNMMLSAWSESSTAIPIDRVSCNKKQWTKRYARGDIRCYTKSCYPSVPEAQFRQASREMFSRERDRWFTNFRMKLVRVLHGLCDDSRGSLRPPCRCQLEALFSPRAMLRNVANGKFGSASIFVIRLPSGGEIFGPGRSTKGLQK